MSKAIRVFYGAFLFLFAIVLTGCGTNGVDVGEDTEALYNEYIFKVISYNEFQDLNIDGTQYEPNDPKGVFIEVNIEVTRRQIVDTLGSLIEFNKILLYVDGTEYSYTAYIGDYVVNPGETITFTLYYDAVRISDAKSARVEFGLTGGLFSSETTNVILKD
jgi:hypothetical protein